ncbi:hypothetical protein [Olivibacter sp. XZL3]|uniref:hypothetical protein n=1 Tax=Olivibacter sp. XZL3 TaxID=1735116 RepID=UPI001064AAB4|nr:hypothetical protein [Olivibacter sp. XZL3]
MNAISIILKKLNTKKQIVFPKHKQLTEQDYGIGLNYIQLFENDRVNDFTLSNNHYVLQKI